MIADIARYWQTVFAPRGRQIGGAWRRLVLASAMRLGAGVAIILAVAAIGLWWQAVYQVLQAKAPKMALGQLTVTVPAGQTVELGWRDLGQRPGETSAEELHMRLFIDASGALMLHNIAERRKLHLFYDGFETDAGRLEIPSGRRTTVTLEGGELTFSRVTGAAFDLDVASSGGRRSFHYDAATRSLAPLGADWPLTCGQKGYLDRIKRHAQTRGGALLGALADRTGIKAFGTLVSGAEEDVATIGGRYDCDEVSRVQIGGIDGVGWRSFKIVRSQDRFLLVPFSSAASAKAPAAILVADEATGATVATYKALTEVDQRIDADGENGELTGFIAGRTRYAVSIDRDGSAYKLAIRPTQNAHLFAGSDCADKEELKSCPRGPAQPGYLSDLAAVQGATSTSTDETGLREWRWERQNNLLGAGDLHLAMLGPWEKLWRLLAPAAAIGLACLLAGGPLHAMRRVLGVRTPSMSQRSAVPLVMAVISAAIALLPAAASYFGVVISPLETLRIMLANWVFATIVLLLGPSGLLLGLLWVSVTLLCAIGSLNLAAMAIDADTTRWLGQTVKHKALFLDFVPTFIIAVASVPAPVLRASIQRYITGDGRLASFARYLPGVILILIFAAWLVIGRQTGFGIFQPVEAGKIGIVILASTALVIADTRLRAGAAAVSLPWLLFSLVVIGGFFAILVAVPFLHSDWSPMLIMLLLLCGIFATFGMLLVLRNGVVEVDRQYRRQVTPRVFKPAFSLRARLRRWWLQVAVIVAALPVIVWATFGSPTTAVLMPLAGTDFRGSENAVQLSRLESDGLVNAIRPLLVERIISWIDLDFGRPPPPDCSFSEGPGQPTASSPADAPTEQERTRACYVDIEFQLIRSRRVIAAGPCIDGDFVAGLASAVRWLGFAGRNETSALAESIVRHAQALCPERSAGESAVPVAADGSPPPGPAPQGPAISPPPRPIEIPAVDSDFSAAFLLGRFGLLAGILFYGAQMLLVTVVCASAYVLAWSKYQGHVDETVRRFVSVILLGALLLLAMQWAFSWVNVLGLLPVMGQPMTFLSYASSHHMFMTLPCLIIFVIAMRLSAIRAFQYTPRVVPQFRQRRS